MADSLSTLIRTARHCVALTGAGISTLSGIPDFRGAGGLYHRTDLDAEKLFDVNYFRRDPSYYYTHAKEFLYSLNDKQPSIVHDALASLENKGILKAVITQNIDLLHHKAGSRHVLEVHGSAREHHCLSCGKAFDFDYIASLVNKGETPRCPCGGIIKPDIVFFGEMLPQDVLAEAEKEATQADLMLILGSSLTVYPAAALPDVTLNRGGKLAIINASPTHLDNRAVWHSNDLAEAFTSLADIL